MDSDEVVSEELQKEIRQVIQTTDATGYMLKRQDILFGKPLRFGETANVRLLRLGKTGCGVWKRSVHEVWEITGSIRSLHHPLLHYPHETLRAFIDDVNRYSTLHARELYKERKRASAFDIVAYPLGKFVYNYVIRQGFRDGTRGTILAFMMSFHSFLARGKLYFLYQKNTKESLKNTRS
ncbi:MAG: hypothetical protein N3A54_05110 [Patescibacteria group bacterium]|nr:hypothetical protein [Patescibacteria group bacterium]